MAEDAPIGGVKMPNILTRKVFGIPVSILALVFVGALLYYAIKMKATPATTDSSDASGDAPEGDLPSTGQPIFLANPSTTTSTGTDDGNAIDVATTPTDQSWSNEAITWLITEGASVTDATNAITKYLAGSQLSQAEGVLRDKAIVKFGAPPESGYQPTSTTGYTGPAVKQGNPPTTHTVKGKSDDTPAELARLYYGMNTADTIRYIESNNTHVQSPYRPGTQIRIPAYHQPKYYKSTGRNNTLSEIARANGTTPDVITALNPGINFPVKVGTRVRVV